MCRYLSKYCQSTVSKYPISLLFGKQSAVKSIDRRQWFWIAVCRWKTSKVRNCVRSLLLMGGVWKVFKLPDSRVRQDLRSYCRWALLFYFQHISFAENSHTVTLQTYNFLDWWRPFFVPNLRVYNQLLLHSKNQVPNINCFIPNIWPSSLTLTPDLDFDLWLWPRPLTSSS